MVVAWNIDYSVRSILFGRFVGSINSLDCRRYLSLALLLSSWTVGVFNSNIAILLYFCLDAGSSGGVYITKRFAVIPGGLVIDLVALYII